MTVRVLIADDHTLFREGLRTLLEKQPGTEVLGEADKTGAPWSRWPDNCTPIS